MNERTVFMTALEKEDSAQRQAYLDEACGSDAVLRERVEVLLRSHEREGKFLDVPAVEQLAAPGRQPDTAGNTQAELAATAEDGQALDFLTPSDKPDSLGRLGHYEIQEVVGRGGMGIVLRAFDDKLHRVVAIKVMAAQLATHATARRRFAREAQAAAAVSHDHIVTIHAVEEADPLPYLVMQYVAGLSLQQRLDRDGPLELPEILRIGMQTASGLAAAHAQGLIHRDIKPANILLENGVERVKVADFGLARAVADASLTQSGVVAGTPQYMSPEQARGEAVDQRTDLFSLGSVLHTMCTGRPPFRASNSMAVLKRICEETPKPIRATNPAIPDWLVGIIEKLHAKDPAQRYQSAAEVAELLGRHLAHVQHPSVVGQVSNVPMERATGWKPVPHLRRWAGAAAVLLCLIAGLSLSEATGVTSLRATVIRIFTPEGTLIVEVDDPGVKVTIEGDGGLVINGAGLQEVRLKPGSYKVRAAKDGKPVRLDHELVTITRDHKQVVNVSLEPAVEAAATGKKGPLASGEIRLFEGHTHHVWSVAYSTDGRHALSGSTDSTVRLWDIGTGKELRCFEGQVGGVTGVAFSSDGRLGLSSGGDGCVIVWDLESGKEVRRCDRHTAPLYCVAISPDDKLAVAGSRGVIILWDVQTGKELRRFKGHKDSICGVAFSPDGRHILSGGGAESQHPYPPDADLTIRWWDVNTGEELTTFKGHTLWVQWVAVSPDGRSALSGSYDGTMRLWDIQTGKQLRRFNYLSGVGAVAFSPNGRFALCGGDSPYHLYLWDLTTGKLLHRFEGHTNKVQSLAFSPDGQSFISGSWDGSLRLWQLPELGLGKDAKPVLLMHFDEADFYEKDGKTYVHDRSGNGNDGLCEQIQFTPEGRTGGGLANAGKGFLRLPSSLITGKSHFTIAGWAKPTQIKKGYTFYTCVHTDYPTRALPSFNLFHNGNYLYAGVWNTAHDWIHAQSPEQNISPGEWSFIAAALEDGAPGKGRLRLMLNDRICERSSQQVGGISLEGVNDIAGLNLDGVLDELAVWDRALSDQELQDLFALGHAPAGKVK